MTRHTALNHNHCPSPLSSLAYIYSLHLTPFLPTLTPLYVFPSSSLHLAVLSLRSQSCYLHVSKLVSGNQTDTPFLSLSLLHSFLLFYCFLSPSLQFPFIRCFRFFFLSFTCPSYNFFLTKPQNIQCNGICKDLRIFLYIYLIYLFNFSCLTFQARLLYSPLSSTCILCLPLINLLP